MTATALSHDSIKISWQDNSLVEKGFTIERFEGIPTGKDDVYENCGVVKTNINEFTDTNLKELQTYSYRVRAYHYASVSKYSDVTNPPTQTLFRKPLAPSGLTLTPQLEGANLHVVVTWQNHEFDQALSRITIKRDGTVVGSTLRSLEPATLTDPANLLFDRSYTYELTITRQLDATHVSISDPVSATIAVPGASNISIDSSGLGGSPSNSTAERFVKFSGSNVTHFKAVVLTAGQCSTANFDLTPERVMTPPQEFRFTPTPNSPNIVCAIGKGPLGNWQSAPSASAVLIVDTLSPTVNIDSSGWGATPSNLTAQRSVALSGDGVSYYKAKAFAQGSCSGVSLSGEVERSISTTFTFMPTNNSSNIVCAIGRDDAGNWQLAPTASSILVIDTLAPSVTIDSSTLGASPSSSLTPRTLALAGDGVTSYKARAIVGTSCGSVNLTAETEKSISTAFVFTPNNNASNIVCAIGRDAAGNWQATPTASTVLVVDTAAPVVSIDSSGLGASPSSSIGQRTITFSGTDVIRYKAKAFAAAHCSGVSLTGEAERDITASFVFTPAVNASNIVCAIGKDVTGNWQSVPTASSVLVIDTLAPTVSIDSAGLGATPSNSLVQRTLILTGAGVTRYKAKAFAAASCTGVSLTGETERDITASFAFMPVDNSSNIVCAIGRDAAGNWQATPSSSTELVIDTVAPSVVIDSTGLGATPSNVLTDRTITLSGSGVVRYKAKAMASGSCSGVSLAGEIEKDIVSSFTFTPANNSFNIVCAIGKDAAGNWQSVTTSSSILLIDTQAPTVAIDSSGLGISPSNSLSARTLSLSGTGVVTYKARAFPADNCTGVSLTGETQKDITASFTFTPTDNSKNIVCAIGKDLAGNWQNLPTASSVLEIITTTPTVSIDSSGLVPTPSNSIANRTVTLGGSRVRFYKAIARPFDNCTGIDFAGIAEKDITVFPSFTFVPGANSSNIVCAIGRDALGNMQTVPTASSVLVIDTQAPTISIDSTGLGSTPSNSLLVRTITLSGAGVTFYKAKAAASTHCTGVNLAAEVEKDISSAFAFTPVDNSPNIVCAIGRDAAGNWQTTTTASSVLVIDTQAPTVNIDSSGLGSTPSNSLANRSLTLSGAGVTRYKAKVIASGSCSGVNLSPEAEADITSSFVFTPVPDASNIVCAIGRDAAGNWQATPTASTVLVIDAQAPTVSIDSTGLGSTPSNSLAARTISLSGTGVVTYKAKVFASANCSGVNLTGEAERNITSTFTFTPADNSSNIVCAIGRDTAGNWQAVPTVSTVLVIDTQAPTVSIDSTGLGSTPSRSLVVRTLTLVGAGVTRYKAKAFSSGSCAGAVLTGEVEKDISAFFSFTPSDNSSNIVCAIGLDAAGNWQSTPTASSVLVIDTIPPAMNINSTGLGSSPSNSFAQRTLTLSGTGVSQYQAKAVAAASCSGVSLAGEPIKDITAVFTFVPIDNSSNIVCAIGGDAAGNWQSVPAESSVLVIDTLAPTVTINSMGLGSTPSNSLLDRTLVLSGEGVVSYKARAFASSNCSGVSLSGEPEKNISLPFAFTPFNNSSNIVCAVGKDNAGNWQATPTGSSVLIIQTNSPTVLIDSTGLGSTPSNSLATRTLALSGTGVSHYKAKALGSNSCSGVSLAGETEKEISVHFAFTPLNNSKNIVCAIGRDALGNWQSVASASTILLVDTVAPADIAIPSLGTLPSNNPAARTITFSGIEISHYKAKAVAAENCGGIILGAETEHALSASFVFTPVNNSSNIICAIGRDEAGNWQATPTASSVLVIDTLAPVIGINDVSFGSSPSSNTAPRTVYFTGSDVVQYKFVVLNQTDCSSADYSAQTTMDFAVNSYTFTPAVDQNNIVCAIGKDSAGNWQTSSTASSVLFINPPSLEISTDTLGVSPSSNLGQRIVSYRSGTGVIAYKAVHLNADDCSSVDFTGAPETDINQAYTFIPLANAKNIICAIGKYGSVWQTQPTASRVLVIDTIPPVISIDSSGLGVLSSKDRTARTVILSGAGVSQYKAIVYHKDNCTGVDLSGETAKAITSNSYTFIPMLGANIVCAIGQDAVGNWQSSASATASAVLMILPDLDAPTSLSIASTAVSVTLSWAYSGPATQMILEKSPSTDGAHPDGYSAQPLVVLPPNILSFVDYSIDESKTYFYRLHATDGTLNSIYLESNTTVPRAATSLPLVKAIKSMGGTSFGEVKDIAINGTNIYVASTNKPLMIMSLVDLIYEIGSVKRVDGGFSFSSFNAEMVLSFGNYALLSDLTSKYYLFSNPAEAIPGNVYETGRTSPDMVLGTDGYAYRLSSNTSNNNKLFPIGLVSHSEDPGISLPSITTLAPAEKQIGKKLDLGTGGLVILGEVSSGYYLNKYSQTTPTAPAQLLGTAKQILGIDASNADIADLKIVGNDIILAVNLTAISEAQMIKLAENDNDYTYSFLATFSDQTINRISASGNLICAASGLKGVIVKDISSGTMSNSDNRSTSANSCLVLMSADGRVFILVADGNNGIRILRYYGAAR